MNKTITIDKDGCIMLSAFRDLVNTAKVEFYTLKINKDKTLTIKFYDKGKKLIKPYEQK